MPFNTYGDEYSEHVRGYRVPLYETDRVYSRAELTDLFARDWPDHRVTREDVAQYVSVLSVHGYLHFPDMPVLPDGAEEENGYGDHVREVAFHNHNLRRTNTRRDRELYDINGAEVFTPSGSRPSPGDDPDFYTRKADRIAALRTDDLEN